jgi:hypothetical protein
VYLSNQSRKCSHLLLSRRQLRDGFGDVRDVYPNPAITHILEEVIIVAQQAPVRTDEEDIIPGFEFSSVWMTFIVIDLFSSVLHLSKEGLDNLPAKPMLIEKGTNGGEMISLLLWLREMINARAHCEYLCESLVSESRRGREMLLLTNVPGVKQRSEGEDIVCTPRQCFRDICSRR